MPLLKIYFAQVDDEGHRSFLRQNTVDHCLNGREVTKEHAFIIPHNGGQCRKKTTQGWEILIQWKDGSTTWESLKDVKESYSVQVANYDHQRKISDDLAFTWWVPHVLKKWDSIIAKVKYK